jgi:CRP/FNR family cyclic AMP-dependent transcriptional regulator
MSEDILARIPIFEDVPAEDRVHAEGLWKPRSLQAGEYLFQRSDPGDSMFVLSEGELEVIIPAEVGQGEVVVSTLRPGDFVGELALLSGMPRTAAARATSDTQLMEMARSDFMAFMEKRPNVAIAMLQEMGKRLRATNELFMNITSKNANDLLDQQLTVGERVADQIAVFGGSWSFIFAFGFFLFSWMGINIIHYWFLPFDDFPFIFLNLMLSCLAAIQAPLIMMSQNRAGKKDRVKADLDYQSGVKSELMLQQLHGKMDALTEHLDETRRRGDS